MYQTTLLSQGPNGGVLIAGREDGGFQEYLLLPEERTFKVKLRLGLLGRCSDILRGRPQMPSNITFEQAATIGTCASTAAIPLYSPSPIGIGRKAPWDDEGNQQVSKPALILGGASSVGQYGKPNEVLDQATRALIRYPIQ